MHKMKRLLVFIPLLIATSVQAGMRCELFSKDLANLTEENRMMVKDICDEERADEKRANAARQKKKEEKNKLEARLSLPNARLGMTAEQVAYQTNWGRPDSINRTESRYGTREQWVYRTNANGYLYFENGILTSIQTSR